MAADKPAHVFSLHPLGVACYALKQVAFIPIVISYPLCSPAEIFFRTLGDCPVRCHSTDPVISAMT